MERIRENGEKRGEMSWKIASSNINPDLSEEVNEPSGYANVKRASQLSGRTI